MVDTFTISAYPSLLHGQLKHFQILLTTSFLLKNNHAGFKLHQRVYFIVFAS